VKGSTALFVIAGTIALCVGGCVAAFISKTNSDEEQTRAAIAVAQAQQKAEAAMTPAQKAAQAKAISDAAEKVKVRQTRRKLAILGLSDLRTSMKDPDSLQLKSTMLQADGSACYLYSATNTYGGRMQEYAVLTPSLKMVANDPTVWNKLCAGKAGDEMVVDGKIYLNQ
jgi:hypothetical protein